MFKLFYGLIKRKWFSKLQAKSLLVPDRKFELYDQDSLKMSKLSLINLTLSNGDYRVKESLRHGESSLVRQADFIQMVKSFVQ